MTDEEKKELQEELEKASVNWTLTKLPPEKLIEELHRRRVTIQGIEAMYNAIDTAQSAVLEDEIREGIDEL